MFCDKHTTDTIVQNKNNMTPQLSFREHKETKHNVQFKWKVAIY